MSAKLSGIAGPKGKCLTNWSEIWGYYCEDLPKLKSRQDKDEEPRWLFRGDSPCPKPWHRRSSKEGAGPLKPSDYGFLKGAFKSRLDQAFEEFGIRTHRVRHKIEWGLMRAFQRKAHLHTGRRDDDWLERLGLMAHYEAPHRMLDWNYSFFNALYFAVNSRHFKEDCIIWALNKRWLREQAERLEEKILEEIKAILGCLKASRMERY
jgi:hypothetical protein